MDEKQITQRLSWMVYLLAANLIVTLAGTVALVFGFLPRLERAVQATERVEARFQGFADDVQPVVTAGAGKAIETIKQMDAKRLSESATDKADALLDSATDRAKRFLERDKEKK